MPRLSSSAPLVLALIVTAPGCGGRASDGDVVGSEIEMAPAPPSGPVRRPNPPSSSEGGGNAPAPARPMSPDPAGAEPPRPAPAEPSPAQPSLGPPVISEPDPDPAGASACAVDSVESFCRFRPLTCILRTLHEDLQVEAALNAAAPATDAGSGSLAAAEAVRAAECDCQGPSGRFTRVSIPSGTTLTTFYYGAGARLSAVSIRVDTPTFCDGAAPEGWYGAPVDCTCTGQVTG